jgi:hypothetical protein
MRYGSIDRQLPILFGSATSTYSATSIETNLDILGSIFFMLSRIEEVVLPDRDKHDRFPACASLAGRAGFLHRPVVDEYVEILWQMMQSLWPQLRRTRRCGSVLVTCDVDTPFDCARSSISHFLKAGAGDLVKRRNFDQAWQRAYGYYSYTRGRHERDENYTFDWYMDTCEQYGQKLIFFFIPDGTAGTIDGCYRLKDRAIRALIRKVSERGHEIGVHGSYNTYKNPDQIKGERKRLIDVCERLGITSPIRGNRQHYLRWDVRQTPDYLDGADFDYDTTGGFADSVGFRYGTARPFPMWSWQTESQLKLVQRPLVFMETSLFAPQYMDMDLSQESMDYALTLKNRALRCGGDFVVLWHNSSLKTASQKAFFEEMIR